MFPHEDDIRKEIRAKRKNLDWSQRKLASKADVSKATIGKFERGSNIPSYRNIRKIYNALMEKDREDPAEDFMVADIVSVEPSDKVGTVAKIMKKNDFSQIPVRDENGEYVGMIVSNQLIGLGEERSVNTIDYRSLPSVGHDTPKAAFKNLLDAHRAVLVKKEENVIGMITAADLL